MKDPAKYTEFEKRYPPDRSVACRDNAVAFMLLTERAVLGKKPATTPAFGNCIVIAFPDAMMTKSRVGIRPSTSCLSL